MHPDPAWAWRQSHCYWRPQSDAQVFRKTQDGGLKVISVNLANALKGDEKDNVLLEPKDRVFIQRTLQKVDPATVIIAGEVARPGKYPLGRDMSAADKQAFFGGGCSHGASLVVRGRADHRRGAVPDR